MKILVLINFFNDNDLSVCGGQNDSLSIALIQTNGTAKEINNN